MYLKQVFGVVVAIGYQIGIYIQVKQYYVHVEWVKDL